MRDETIAKSYAETLFELAQRHEGIGAYAGGIETVARLLEENPSFRLFLETPRHLRCREEGSHPEGVRGRGAAAAPPLPSDHGRQAAPATPSGDRARVSRPGRPAQEQDSCGGHRRAALDEATIEKLSRGLTRLLGKEAIPHVRVKPALLGGAIFRTGDTIYDGSLRRRLARMRKRLVSAELPQEGGTGPWNG